MWPLQKYYWFLSQQRAKLRKFGTTLFNAQAFILCLLSASVSLCCFGSSGLFPLQKVRMPDIIFSSSFKEGARGSVVGWGTMLQAGMSRVRFLMRSLNFFNWPNPSSRTMALESTQSITEMSTRNLPGGKGRSARKAYHHLWADF
jgi:hypothetical protein